MPTRFLRLKGLTTSRCTIERPPRFDTDGNHLDVTDEEKVLASKADNDNSTSEHTILGHRGSLAKTKGIRHNKPYRNDSHAAPPNSQRILVWSAGDESGFVRLMDGWRRYFLKRVAGSASEETSFVDKFGDTLDLCRSSPPWKAFATVDSMSKLPHLKLISRPIRSSGVHNVEFAFTGEECIFR